MCRGVVACPGDERIVATVTEGDEMSRVSQPVLEFLPVEACSVGASAGLLVPRQTWWRGLLLVGLTC